MIEAELLAAIDADPDDVTARQVYADHLISRGDERGELISLDLAERDGRELTNLEPLLRLAAIHGFPRWPGDPDDALLPTVIDPEQRAYCMRHGELDYYVSYRNQSVIITERVDWVSHYSPALELHLHQRDELTAHQADVILSIINRTLRLEHDLALIEWPHPRSFDALERFARKRRPHYHLELGLLAPGRPAHPDPRFGVIDYERWGLLWQRWERARRR